MRTGAKLVESTAQTGENMITIESRLQITAAYLALLPATAAALLPLSSEPMIERLRG
jgi:hypothetical protein